MSRNVRPLDCFAGPAARNEDTDLTSKVILTGTCLFFLRSKLLDKKMPAPSHLFTTSSRLDMSILASATVVDYQGFVDVFFSPWLHNYAKSIRDAARGRTLILHRH